MEPRADHYCRFEAHGWASVGTLAAPPRLADRLLSLRPAEAGEIQIMRRFWRIPLSAVLMFALWYGAVVVWARILRRVERSVSAWEELEQPAP